MLSFSDSWEWFCWALPNADPQLEDVVKSATKDCITGTCKAPRPTWK